MKAWVNHPLVWLALGGFVVSLVSMYIWLQVNGTQQVSVFGFVESVTVNELSILERSGEVLLVPVSGTVVIKRRRSDVPYSELQVGQFVHATGIVDEEGVRQITTIRLLKPPQ